MKVNMISIYILCTVLFPLLALWKIKTRDQQTSTILLSKNDTLYLRGVSACFVLFAHFCTYLNQVTAGMNRLFYAGISQLGGIGVLIFFFASGYGIYESYADKTPNRNYLIKRGGSIYLPYLIIKLCILGLELIAGVRTKIGIRDLVAIVTVENWFIHIILIQYIIFYVIWRYFGKKKIIIYSIIADLVLSMVYFFWQRPDRWFNALWLFTFGMACSLRKKEIRIFFAEHVWVRIALCCAGFAVFGVIFVANKGVYWANLFKPVSGAFLCIAICGIMCQKEFTSRIMAYFGKRSMYLYIVQIPVWSVVNIDEPIEKFWVSLLFSLIFMELIYRFVEAFTKYAFRLEKGK